MSPDLPVAPVSVASDSLSDETRSEIQSRSQSLSELSFSSESLSTLSGTSTPSAYATAQSSTPSRGNTPIHSSLAFTPLDLASRVSMDDGAVNFSGRRASGATSVRHRRSSARRRSSAAVASSPVTRLRALSTLPDGSALDDEDELPSPAPGTSALPDEEAPQGISATVSEMFTELSRKVSVEAGAGPMALYAPRPRTGSSSTVQTNRSGRARASSRASVSFQETEPVRRERRPTVLPRIDSEKTLAPEDYELGRSKSRFSAVMEEKTPANSARPSLEADEAEMEAIVGEMSKTRKILLGLCMMLEVVISSISTNAVLLTIPSLAADLGVSQIEGQWVSSAYALSFGCGLLFAGRLADIYGRKMLFLSGLAWALVMCIVSGVVRSLVPLCVVRALAGLGLAIATPAGFGILGVTFRTNTERTIAFSCFGLGNPVGASLGMLIGGGVASAATRGWQWLYFVLAGMCLIPLLLGVWVIPREPKRDNVDKRVDWLGGLLVTAALCLFTFSITESGIAPRGWKTPYIPALLAVSVLLFLAFGLWERHIERTNRLPPIAKLSLFTRNGWKITLIMAATFCVFVAIAGWVYAVSLFYQEYKGLSALGNAIHVLPASLCGTFASLAVMYVVPRFRAPYILAAGGFLSGLSCLLFALAPPDATYWSAQFVAMLLLPFGADLTVGIGSILMSNLCEDDEQSVGGALFQTSTQIAGALGVCMASLVVTDIGRENYLKGLQHTFGMCTAWAWVVVLLSAIFLRKMGLAREVGRGSAMH